MLRDLALGARVVLAAPFAVLSWMLDDASRVARRVARAILRGDAR